MEQSRARVAWAPQSTSTEYFPELAVVVLPFLNDEPALRPRTPPALRSAVTELLGALVISGLPWNSSQSIARAAYAPENQSGDVLLALVLPFGPWLNTPPAISRYTIITLAQEDVVDLPDLVPPKLYFDMAEPWAIGKVIRSGLLARIRVHDDALPGIGFSAYFVQAGPGRIVYFRQMSRTIRVPVAEDDLIRVFEPKPPAEVDSINFDFSARCEARGDTIASVTELAVVDSADNALTLTNIAESGGIVSAEWSDGTLETEYTLECIVATTAGRTWQVRATVFIAY